MDVIRLDNKLYLYLSRNGESMLKKSEKLSGNSGVQFVRRKPDIFAAPRAFTVLKVRLEKCDSKQTNFERTWMSDFFQNVSGNIGRWVTTKIAKRKPEAARSPMEVRHLRDLLYNINIDFSQN